MRFSKPSVLGSAVNPAGEPADRFVGCPVAKPYSREREVVELISNGRSNKQGAALLNISPRTYESHRAVAMRKLKVRNLAELVRVVLTASFER